MKVLFLDLDGVVITGKSITRFDDNDAVDHYVVDLLNKIINITDAKIVISSTRRFGKPVHFFQKWLHRYGLRNYRSIVDKTPYHTDGHRGREIQAWLDDNPVDNFAIIDDVPDGLSQFEDKLFITDFAEGLTDSIADDIIRLFI